MKIIALLVATIIAVAINTLYYDPTDLWLPQSLGLDSLSWAAGALIMAIMSTAAFVLYWLTGEKRYAEQEYYICYLKERILQLKERNAHARMRIEQLQIAEQTPKLHKLGRN